MMYLYFQKLRHTESDRLSVQVHAYLDNMIDVAALLEDSETKTEALEKAAELEDELSQVSDERDIDYVSTCILRHDRCSCSPRRLRNQN